MSNWDQIAHHHSWAHVDHKEAEHEVLGMTGDVDGIEIFGQQVLIGVYIRPIMSGGNNLIITLGKQQKEDIYQGKVGLVLKVGPRAFGKEQLADFNGRLPARGDWVYFNVNEAFEMSVKGPGALPSVEVLNLKAPDGSKLEREWKQGWPCRLIYGKDIYGRIDTKTTNLGCIV